MTNLTNLTKEIEHLKASLWTATTALKNIVENSRCHGCVHGLKDHAFTCAPGIAKAALQNIKGAP